MQLQSLDGWIAYYTDMSLSRLAYREVIAEVMKVTLTGSVGEGL